jgi:hypothetical protein
MEGPRQHLVRAQELLVYHEYEAALRENQEALSMSDSKAPADEALFNIGLLFAHPGNPGRDQRKSVVFFQKLLNDFPQSPQAEQARVWIEVLQENERLGRVSAETLKENERLRRVSGEAFQENDRLKRASAEAAQENERLKRASAEAAQEIQKLKRIVEQSSMVDIEIDEKKRNQAK